MTPPGASSPILEPGRNCTRIDRAGRFRCIQDGADYFRLVRQALLQARHTVFILGWDIAGAVDLLPGEDPSDGPTQLDKLIAFIARRRPTLRCYILIWDYGSLHTLERDPLSRFRFGWGTPRRVRFEYDDRHPVGGCHHQKIVTIDDSLAFSGSIDLTGHRWDTTEHLVDHPHRTSMIGAAYGPYHEVQVMMDGPVAASLGRLARDRWRALGVERLPDVQPGTKDLWPDAEVADLTDIDVAIARTVPVQGDDPAVRECETLFYDAIAAARRSIYIENQYFTNARLAGALAARLAEPDGPEIVIATPKDSYGWLETNTMRAYREAAFRDLVAADAHGRLRLVCPMASRAGDVSTFIHAKVMVVDDALLRIGSANCSNRSMGVDTECDIAVEAGGDANVAARIVGVRNRLFAEHSGLAVDEVERLLKDTGSLCGFIDAQHGRDRGLAPFVFDPEATEPVEALRMAADPESPIGLGSEVDQLIPSVDAASGRGPVTIWLLPSTAIGAVALVAMSAAAGSARTWLAWLQGLLVSVPDTPAALTAGAATFVFAAAWLVPIELLIVTAGLVFGPLPGAGVALSGAMGAAGLGYTVGRVLGPVRIARWMSRRSYRSGRQLRARGVTDIAAMQLSRVAGMGALHLLCGAGRVRIHTFLPGILAGVLPIVVLASWLGGLLRETVLQPSMRHGLQTVGAAVLLVVVARGLRTLLLMRQFAPGAAGHDRRRTFG